MTTVVILMIGFGAILIVSAFETDPKTGKDTSVLQTFSDVWNGNVNFTQPAPAGASSSSSSGGNSGGQSSGITQPGIAPGTGAPSLGFRGDMVRHNVRYRYGA